MILHVREILCRRKIKVSIKTEKKKRDYHPQKKYYAIQVKGLPLLATLRQSSQLWQRKNAIPPLSKFLSHKYLNEHSKLTLVSIPDCSERELPR